MRRCASPSSVGYCRFYQDNGGEDVSSRDTSRGITKGKCTLSNTPAGSIGDYAKRFWLEKKRIRDFFQIESYVVIISQLPREWCSCVTPLVVSVKGNILRSQWMRVWYSLRDGSISVKFRQRNQISDCNSSTLARHSSVRYF